MASVHMYSNVGYPVSQTGASEAQVMSNVGMTSPFGDPRSIVSFGWGEALAPAITVLAPETTGRGSTSMYANVEEPPAG